MAVTFEIQDPNSVRMMDETGLFSFRVIGRQVVSGASGSFTLDNPEGFEAGDLKMIVAPAEGSNFTGHNATITTVASGDDGITVTYLAPTIDSTYLNTEADNILSFFRWTVYDPFDGMTHNGDSFGACANPAGTLITSGINVTYFEDGTSIPVPALELGSSIVYVFGSGL